jgi:hypothetical protein
MAGREQLEIISPAGEIYFAALDHSDGVTNIGRNPSNDVVLSGAQVADFHLVLDHRSYPFQIAALSEQGAVVASGQRLAPHAYQALQPWDTIEVGGFTLILVESEDGQNATSSGPTGTPGSFAGLPAPSLVPPPAPLVPQPGSALPSAPAPGMLFQNVPLQSPPTQSPPAQSPPAQSVGPSGLTPIPGTPYSVSPPIGPTSVVPGGASVSLIAIPQGAGNGANGAQNGASQSQFSRGMGDHMDETVVVEITEREQAVGVEQTAEWQLSVANGGPLVARFEVRVEGDIDPSWVTILPVYFNLNEGERALVTVAVTPPRAPTSRAGLHHFCIVVSSPNYPENWAQRAVTLTVNPYYDFSVGEVSPKQQNVSYFRRSGKLTLPIQNRSNTDVAFRLEGSDDENLVTFEFAQPGSDATLVRQVELLLHPSQQVIVPVTTTPRDHRIVGVGAHLHSLTLTTSMGEGSQAPRAVMAQLRNRPIVGPAVIMALLVLLGLVGLFMLQPSIESFTFAPANVRSSQEMDATSGPNASNVAAAAANLQGKKLFGFKIPKLPKLPKQLGFLNNLLQDEMADGALGEPQAAQAVYASMTDAGQDVVLTWNTSLATSLTIEKITGGVTEFIATVENPSQQRQYAFRAEERERATYVLTARNWIERLPLVGETFGRAEARAGLIVDPVQPLINLFDVSAQALVTGQSVDIAWQVDKAFEYELLVNQVPRPLGEARGVLQERPATTTEYQLVARSPYWDEPIFSERKVVVVALPTPVIRAFDIEPRPIIDGEKVVVSWDVEGASVVTINPVPGPVPNLQGRDEGEIEPGKTQQTFTLRAVYGEGPAQVVAQASRVIDIVLATATPSPTYTPTPTPTSSSTPIPTPLVRLFDIEPKPIIDGENVRLSWAVSGASNVEINPKLGVAPNLEGQSEFTIDEGKTQETFTLRAVFNDNGNQVEVRVTRVVLVVTATPTVTPTPTATSTATPQTPVIQVFNLLPKEVVRGDQAVRKEVDGVIQEQLSLPQLTWTIIGAATNVEVTGPDFGPVRNLPKEGTLRVPVDKTTVFQLNVYLNEQLITSQTQELTVLEPTATPVPTETPVPPPPPTPTPTATPAPNIAVFSVNAVNAASDVVPVASQDNVPTYDVRAGATVRFAWRVENLASDIKLVDSVNDYGSRSPEDEFQLQVTQSSLFRLVVLGTGTPAGRFERTIRLNVLPITPPPSPFNVTGTDGADELTASIVRWTYPGESQSKILGFRVYRANVDTFDFVRVANYFELDSTKDSWIDPATPSCDRVYYVVAVYEDITRSGDDRIQESLPSIESWYTKLCRADR